MGTSFGTPAMPGEGEVIMRSSHEIAGKVIKYLNLELLWIYKSVSTYS